jgi:hypothetical protein
MEKKNVRENRFFCSNCLHSFSFFDENLKVKEVKEIQKKSGNSKERMRRFRERRNYQF